MTTIGSYLSAHARLRPRSEAIVGVGGRLTYGELATRSWALARGLRSRGVRRETPVGVLGGNTLFSAEAFFGVAASGGVFVPYNWRWSARELADGILETRAPLILVEAQFESLLQHALALCDDDEYVPVVVRQGGELDGLMQSGGPLENVSSPEDALCIIYTGGTTGRSKGVVLTHSAAIANAANEMLDCRIGTRPDERGLILTPLFHSAALLCWLVPQFIAGATSVIAPRFDEETVIDLVERERITNTFLVPNMMRQLLEKGAFRERAFQTHFRALHTGAGLLRMPDKLAFRDALPDAELFFRYGLTEAGPMVTRLLPGDMLDEAVDGSIGTEYTFAEARLLRDDDSEAAVGELGEIVVRGPSLMREYYGRPDATAEALRGGWLRTGDLAVRDERGYFFFRDRSKDMIKTGGENVYAAEVEQILYLHPAVLEASVLGVPDPRWDEEVRAVIALRAGMSATESDLRAYLRTHLAGYKIPKQMAFIEADKFPKTPAGKVVKSQLRKDLEW